MSQVCYGVIMYTVLTYGQPFTLRNKSNNIF